MRVVFGEHFDQGAWPGPLGGRDAAYDEAWVGPLGLLGLLETALGLSAPHDVGEAERAASIVPALRACAGPWSRSMEGEADHLAVARAVLRLRDALVLAGLPLVGDVHPDIGPRLTAFLEVARGVRAGLPERIDAVGRAARSRPIDIECIEVVDEAPWPALQTAFDALATAGVVVAKRALLPCEAHGDLAGARAARFSPAGDGTLQLLRGDCVEESAVATAAHLAAIVQREGTASVVMVGPDDALDAGLARLGLPTVGARGEAVDDALLQVAPLLVALAWPERDPERALELLSLPSSPVRRNLAAHLAGALAKEPGVGSPPWQRALDDALGAMPEGERARARERVDEVFGGPTADQAMTLAIFEQRLDIARRWLFGRAAGAPDQGLVAALAQVTQAARIARALGLAHLSRIEVTRILAQATEAVCGEGPRPALAGFHVVGDAAAVVAPARHVVWWGFDAAAERPPSLPILSADERRGLVAAGARLASPATLAERRARAYARPLACAGRTLLLVCSHRDARGDEAHPHPLWDEIVARAGNDVMVAPLVRRTSVHAATLRQKVFRARDLPAPLGSWRAGSGAVPLAESESPQGREALLGCTFRAAMQRAGLRERLRALPDGRRLFGHLAHEVIAQVLRSLPESGAVAAERARAAVDVAVPRRAATLLRPEERSQLLRSREAIVRAAERVVETLIERGAKVRDVEQDIVLEKNGRVVRGRPDLVVTDPLVVIDFKSGPDAPRREALEHGAAVQLVAYAALLHARDGQWPELAYFLLRSCRLFTTSVALGGTHAVDPYLTVEQSYQRLKKGIARADAEVAEGRLSAPGVGARVPLPVVRGGELPVAPPCQMCAFGALCGRLLPGGTEPA